MRVGTFLVVCVLLFVSCEEKRVAIGGLPFQITRGEEWGIIGMNGEIKMINAFAHRPSALVNERLSVPDDSGKYGLYSFSGELKSVSPKSFTTIGYFFEEVTLAQEKKNEPLLVVDKFGEKVAIVDNYQGHEIRMAHNFKEGLALVYTNNVWLCGYSRRDGN